jgi:hypothetical protein
MFFAAALAAASLALPAAAQPDLAPVNVSGKAPTTLRISIGGLEKAAVRRQVGAAAHSVCRNAIRNRELDLFDFQWCSDGATRKAMHRYSQMTQGRVLAGRGVILLSAR